MQSNMIRGSSFNYSCVWWIKIADISASNSVELLSPSLPSPWHGGFRSSSSPSSRTGITNYFSPKRSAAFSKSSFLAPSLLSALPRTSEDSIIITIIRPVFWKSPRLALGAVVKHARTGEFVSCNNNNNKKEPRTAFKSSRFFCDDEWVIHPPAQLISN